MRSETLMNPNPTIGDLTVHLQDCGLSLGGQEDLGGNMCLHIPLKVKYDPRSVLHRGTGVWINEDVPKHLAQMAIEELRTIRDALVKADLGGVPTVHRWVQLFSADRPKFVDAARTKIRIKNVWATIDALNAACTGYGDWIKQGMPVKITQMATPAPVYLMRVETGHDDTMFAIIGECNPLFGVPNPNETPGKMSMVNCQLLRADRIEPYLL